MLSPPSGTQPPIKHLMMQVAGALAAAAAAPGPGLPEADRREWAELLLGWLTAPASSEEVRAHVGIALIAFALRQSGQSCCWGGCRLSRCLPSTFQPEPLTQNPIFKLSKQLRVSAAAALTELSSAPGPGGLHVAAAWLGELLVALSQGVTPYTALRVLPQVRERRGRSLCTNIYSSMLGRSPFHSCGRCLF